MNFDHEIKNTNQIDNTKQRILGEEIKVPNETTYQTYGQFPTAQDKYKKTGIKEKIFEDFFKCYVNDSQNDKSQLEQSIQNIRLYDTTNRNKLITQPVDYSSLGRRHMVTQDNIPVNPTTVDKLFMASHDMGKFPSIIHENIAKEYVDSYVPYYKDKEVTFWSMNLEKGNMYKSAANGINAFAKSSGFTQPIHLTKSVSQFEGNVNMTNTHAKNVHLNESDVKFSEEYKSFKTRQQEVVDLIPDIRNKIFTACLKRGSLGLRHLKIFLLNLSKRLYDRIDKSNFKYFLINYGIALNDKEIDFIYQRFDTKRNSEINFNEFLDSIRYVNEERLNHMKNFYDQLTLEDFVSFKKLEGNLRPDLHPEVNELIYPRLLHIRNPQMN